MKNLQVSYSTKDTTVYLTEYTQGTWKDLASFPCAAWTDREAIEDVMKAMADAQ